MSQIISLDTAVQPRYICENLPQTRLLVRELFEIMDEMLANRDHYTFLHAVRVAEISRRIGTLLELPEAELEILELGSLVHDIGKVAIPDDVLLKPGRFDWQDRKIMELHPLIGARLFSKRLVDDRLIEIILNHHERLDGSGYPNGLPSSQIGILVRIVAVADVYEALVAMRPYQSPLPHSTAMRILQEEVLAHKLDGEVVALLGDVTKEWSPLSIVRDFAHTHLETLESFRRKTYFREPLSEFYNYRYLLARDQKKELGNDEQPYALAMIDFKRLREFNIRYGYVKADKCLDEIGGRIHGLTRQLNGQLGREAVLLVRKGADYLIYSTCPEHLIRHLYAEIQQELNQAEEEYGLSARFLSRCYPAGYPVERALNDLFLNHETC